MNETTDLLRLLRYLLSRRCKPVCASCGEPLPTEGPEGVTVSITPKEGDEGHTISFTFRHQGCEILHAVESGGDIVEVLCP